MKHLLYTLILVSTLNCGSSAPNVEPGPEIENSGQENVQNDILVGTVHLQDFQEAPHDSWFDPMYKSYQPDPESLETIRQNINDYKIKAFMGTWCGDSRREIPKLYKLLELADYNLDNLEMKAVKHDKTLPNDIQKEYDIHYVPTIIFYKDGKEVGRFVEYAQEEFEEDIAKIVSGEEYKHSYE